MMRMISSDLRAPAKPIANIKQVAVSRKEAFGVLYFVKSNRRVPSQSVSQHLLGSKPNNLLDASIVCRTNEWSAGNETPANSRAHLMPYKAAVIDARILQELILSQIRIFFCPVHNASTPCSLQAFGIRCIQ